LNGSCRLLKKCGGKSGEARACRGESLAAGSPLSCGKTAPLKLRD
jgi:hypothetical protein